MPSEQNNTEHDPIGEFQKRKFALSMWDSIKALNPEILSGNEWLDMVRVFHKVYGQPLRFRPTKLTIAEGALRENLLTEEFQEFEQGIQQHNWLEVVDALGDMLYVILGTFITLGVDPDKIMREIQLSNMSKLGADGKPILRSDGKVLKGPNYFKPNLKPYIEGLK